MPKDGSDSTRKRVPWEGEELQTGKAPRKSQTDPGAARRKRSDDGKGEAKVVAVTPSADLPVVIDAGFDAFVTGNWDGLVAGDGKRFQFPVFARETLVELSIESAPCSYDTDTDQCFRLEPDNWLISMLTEPIELGYDSSLQRLARFRGVSNISDGSGSGLLVDIRYRYDDLAAQRCDK